MPEVTQEDLNQKMQEYHEYLLKNTAMTFSLEGASKDLRSIIHKKISYNKACLIEMTKIIQALSGSPSKELRNTLLKKTDMFHQMFDHVFTEMRIIDNVLNITIEQSLQVEKSLKRPRSRTNVQTPA